MCVGDDYGFECMCVWLFFLTNSCPFMMKKVREPNLMDSSRPSVSWKQNNESTQAWSQLHSLVAGTHRLHKQVYLGNDKEEFLFVVAAALMVTALCSSFPLLISNGFSLTTPMFQSNMGVIAMVIFYAQMRPLSVHGVEEIMSSLWMFGSLFLFTSLGTNISVRSFRNGIDFLPAMLVGFMARFAALLFIGFVCPLDEKREIFLRGPGHSKMRILYEVLFALCTSCPRASVQGALARIPGILVLFDADTNDDILVAGIFVLALMAPVGSVILDYFGDLLLHKIKESESEVAGDNLDGGVNQDQDWRARDRAFSHVQNLVRQLEEDSGMHRAHGWATAGQADG